MLFLFSGRLSHAEGVANSFFPTGISGGGRLMSASINPADPSQNFVVCDMSGLYRTSNEGLTWRLIPSDVFSTTPQTRIQFAGTGSGQRIYGIRRFAWGSNRTRPSYSADGGDSWTDLAEPPSPSENDQYYYLSVDPASTSASTQRLVVDNYQKLWFSNGGGASGSWTLIHTRSGGGPDSVRLAGAFWDGSTIYVGTNVGLFRSTDSGANWSLVTGYSGLPAGQQIVDFCGAKHPGTGVVTLFAICVENTYTVEGWHDLRNLDEDATYLGLYTLTLTGSPSWVSRSGPSGEVFVRVDASTGDSTKPWAATSRNLTEPGIFKSTDGGVNWAQTFKTAEGGYTANQNVATGYQGDGGISSWESGEPGLALEVSDGDPDRVIATSDALHLTDDGGTSWMQMYVDPETENAAGSAVTLPKAYRHSGLGLTTGHWMHWIDADHFLCASTDVGVQTTEDGGVSWTTDHTHVNLYGQLTPPNYNCIVQKPGASRLYAAVSDLNDFYEPERLNETYWSDFGDVYYSDDGGETWASIRSIGSSGLPSGEFPGPVVELAVDPASPTHLYVASSKLSDGGVYRTTDGGSSWSKLTDPSRTEGHPLSIRVLGSGKLVVTYCARVSGQDGNGVDVYTASSGVFYSTDGGSTWSDRTDADMQYFTRDLAVNPDDDQNWFAAVQSRKTNTSGSNPTYDGLGGVYATADSGAHWNRIWAHDQVVSVTYVPGQTPVLYVTTANDGLWFSTDPNATTPAFAKIESFPFSRVRRVFADPYRTDGTIWVTTQGGGLWRGTVAPTMSSRVARNGAHYDLEVDVTGSGGGAPALQGITDLAASPSGWTTITSITPGTSTPASGVTRYTWASVDGDSLFSSVNGGYARATRTRPDGTTEASQAQGWILEEIQSAQMESWGVPWLTETEHESAAASLGSTLVLSEAIPASLVSGRSYYVEILEGPHEGHRIEVVEASTSGSVIVLDSASGYNTLSPLPHLNGERIALRQHLTLGDAFPLSDFIGTGNAATSDRVQFYNGTSWIIYWRVNYASLNRWVKMGDATLADQGGMILPPGEGVILDLKGSGSARIVHGSGGVRSGAFCCPVVAGTRLYALGHPQVHSPAINHLLAADGFVAQSSQNGAEKVLIWKGDATPGGSGYDTYWYFTHPSFGTYWAKVGDSSLANQDGSSLFPLQRAFLITANSAKPGRVVPCPWTP